MKFTKQFLRDVIFEDNEEAERIENKFLYSGRWTESFNLVFRYKDKFYSIEYRKGSTEQQDEKPFEYEEDEIECQEVEPVEVKVIQYKPIKGK